MFRLVVIHLQALTILLPDALPKPRGMKNRGQNNELQVSLPNN